MSKKWIVSTKGEGVRSRPVARDVKAKCDKGRPDLFASSLPLDVIKVVLVMARQDLKTSSRC